MKHQARLQRIEEHHGQRQEWPPFCEYVLRTDDAVYVIGNGRMVEMEAGAHYDGNLLTGTAFLEHGEYERIYRQAQKHGERVR